MLRWVGVGITMVCIIAGRAPCQSLDTANVSAAFAAMATKLAAVKRVRDAKLDAELASVQAELVGVFQESSLKLSKGDEDLLDDVIGPRLIGKAEQGTLAFSCLVTDTFFNTFLFLGVVDFLEVQYYCVKAQLTKGTPVYLVAAQVTKKEQYPYTSEMIESVIYAEKVGKAKVLQQLQNQSVQNQSDRALAAGASAASDPAAVAKQRLAELAAMLGDGSVLVSRSSSGEGDRDLTQALVKLAGCPYCESEMRMLGREVFSVDSLVWLVEMLAKNDTVGFYQLQGKVPKLETPLQKKVFLNSPEGQALRNSYPSDKAAFLGKTYWVFGLPLPKTTYDLNKQAFCFSVPHDWAKSGLFFETAFPVVWNIDRRKFVSLQGELDKIAPPPLTDECRRSLMGAGLASALFGVSLGDGSEECSQLEMAALDLYGKKKSAVCAKFGLPTCKRNGTFCLGVPETEAVAIEPFISTSATLLGFRVTTDLIDGKYLKCVDGQIAVCDFGKPNITIIKRFVFK